MLAALVVCACIGLERADAHFVESAPAMGIDYVQGYGVAMPRPLAEVLDEILGDHGAEQPRPSDKGGVDVVQRA